ncbi:hypothetical protein [Kordiimonas sp.]|uniref:hypothetical protein n=1 Tax=Kordiimonas sp. TaxID=1970157 RepID=UPI003A9342D1
MISKMFRKPVTCGLMALAITTLPTTVSAAPSEKDVLVASRALNFISPKPSGEITAAIIYDASNAASKADAEGLAAIIGGGMKAGKVTLVGKLVDVNDMAAMKGSAIAFVAEGTAAHHSAIAAAVSGAGILTASTDLSCVRSAQCALGVSTDPKVEIFVNKSAASAAGVEFLPAFLMMVKEV